MLTLDLTSTSSEFINWQAVTNALLKGEPVSVKQAGVEIGKFLPSTKTTFNKSHFNKSQRQLGFMLNEGSIPKDIHWGDDEIQTMFEDAINHDKDFLQ